MPKWLKCILPCFRNTRQECTGPPKNESLTDFESNKINDDDRTAKDTPEEEEDLITVSSIEKSEITLTDENSGDNNANTDGKLTELDDNIEENHVGDHARKLITCTLHESLYDICHSKVTHTSLKPRSPSTNYKIRPHNTLVFQTVMLNGEPCTTRYKTTEQVEPNLEKTNSDFEETGKKLAEEIRGSDIKLVFSHDVLEYLTKSFLHNKDNDLNRSNLGANDTVVCTLFPKYINPTDERNDCEMEVETNIMETSLEKSLDLGEPMDIDDISSSTEYCSTNITMQTENERLFNVNQLTPRNEFQLTPSLANNQMIHINSPISKSFPYMQENNNNSNNKEIPRLRRNMSKRVSWKENVEVCFFNHSSKSANEILQEEQPLIDHEVYWRECVGEMDRKRRELWLKVRADEQRCLTGDGQFHDYFACRMHHFDED